MLDQLQPGKFDFALREIAFELGELDQGEDDRVVGGGGQAVFLRSLDDTLAGDELFPPLVVNRSSNLMLFWPLGTRSVSRAIGNSAKFISSLPGAAGKRMCRLVASGSCSINIVFAVIL